MELSGQFHTTVALSPENPSRPHWIGVWVVPIAGLDAVVKREMLPLQEIEPLPSSP
jgi:hypothetical protein